MLVFWLLPREMWVWSSRFDDWVNIGCVFCWDCSSRLKCAAPVNMCLLLPALHPPALHLIQPLGLHRPVGIQGGGRNLMLSQSVQIQLLNRKRLTGVKQMKHFSSSWSLLSVFLLLVSSREPSGLRALFFHFDTLLRFNMKVWIEKAPPRLQQHRKIYTTEACCAFNNTSK